MPETRQCENALARMTRLTNAFSKKTTIIATRWRCIFVLQFCWSAANFEDDSDDGRWRD
jgi:hypothetical protein